jgi:phenylacetate-CoA ligase
VSGCRILGGLLRLRRSERLSRAAVRQLQEAKLRRLVRHAGATVPLYRDLWREAGVDPAEIRTLGDLERLPTVDRELLQSAGDAALSEDCDRARLARERTSGSSGRPLGVFMEPRHRDLRRSLFLRALVAAGYRPGKRIVLVREAGRTSPARLGWHELSHDLPPEQLAAEIRRLRPALVYGWVSTLRLVAEALEADGRAGLRASVLTTAESLDPESRALLERAFGGRVREAYGSTELGMVGWQCSRAEGLHLAEDAVLVEGLEDGSARAPRPLVATNLDLRAMPLVRYETGDLVGPPVPGACGCGSSARRVTGVEGRLVDCIRLPSGGIVSPYRVTLALEGVPGLARYRVLQSARGRVEVSCQAAGDAHWKEIEEAARGRLRSLLGGEVEVLVARRTDLDAPSGRKFRVVESRIGA